MGGWVGVFVGMGVGMRKEKGGRWMLAALTLWGCFVRLRNELAICPRDC